MQLSLKMERSTHGAGEAMADLDMVNYAHNIIVLYTGMYMYMYIRICVTWYTTLKDDYVSCIHLGNAEDKNVPTLVQGLAGHKVVGVELGSGDAHTLALEDNGKHADYFNVEFYAYNFFSGAVWSWGDGDFGKLGRGGSEGSKSPKVIPNFGDIVKIRCGRQFSVALTREGKVFTW